jgi:PmbA protein
MKTPLSSSDTLSKTASKTASQAGSASSGFAYTLPFFESLVDTALAEAKKIGATDAGVEVSEGCGLSVSVRNGELENVERNRDKSMGVTVYVGQRRGNYRRRLLRQPTRRERHRAVG